MTAEFAEIRRKFREGQEFDSKDRQTLKRYIQFANDVGVKAQAIYLFGYSFDLDQDILPTLRDIIISIREPELSAKAIGALCYYWGVLDQELIEAFLFYLDESRWDLFFEECQAIYRVYLDNTKCPLMAAILPHLRPFVAWAKSEGYDFDEL